MLKIKLARFGKKNQPMYRIVVNEARSKRDGEYVASLGKYAPTMTPKILEVDLQAYDAWVVKGAQPTDKVAALVAGLKSGTPFREKPKKVSKRQQAKAAAAAEAAQQETTEAPAA